MLLPLQAAACGLPRDTPMILATSDDLATALEMKTKNPLQGRRNTGPLGEAAAECIHASSACCRVCEVVLSCVLSFQGQFLCLCCYHHSAHFRAGLSIQLPSASEAHMLLGR